MAHNLVIGDIHAPVTHPGYLAFCRDIYEAWNCNRVTFIGDVVDWHAISFHAAHPEAPGPRDEYELAHRCIRHWYTAFPRATVMIGNHDARVVRLAESVHIPAKFIRAYADVWDTPGWDWRDDDVLDDVYYFHGIGYSGFYPAANAMRQCGMSVVIGHVHTAGGIHWACNPQRRIFGMDTGCGIDDRAAAMAYGKHAKRKSMLSCGVVIDGTPYHEPMPMGRGECYHRSRFKKGGAPV